MRSLRSLLVLLAAAMCGVLGMSNPAPPTSSSRLTELLANGEKIPAPTPEPLPDGVIRRQDDWTYPTNSVKSIEAGAEHKSPFQVTPKHIKMPSGNDGVMFNVETVPGAHPKHLHKTEKTRNELKKSIAANLAKQYTVERVTEPWDPKQRAKMVNPEDIRLEALSETRDKNLVHVGGDGFAMALVTAFAQHLPLTLSPDHIWILISHAFAKHVDQNAEALRKNFVQHEGKKRLEVVTPSSFAMSADNNPDTGASAKDWETVIFPEFSGQIQAFIGETTHHAIAGNFSTSSATARAAHEITLMSAMKHYFSFGMTTMCGIPNITLLGTEEDWVALRSRAETLGPLMLPDFSNYWMPLLLPILDEFVESYTGNVNHGFWQSMVKLRNTGGGSGARDFISGWMQILFPYLARGNLNERLKPWQEMYFEGPELEQFPHVDSYAPVDWDYFGTVYDLTFHAGVLGFTQDSGTGALSPMLGWYVSHVPPKSLEDQLKDYKKELKDLLLGHKEDAAAKEVDTSAPWYRRVKFLQDRIEEIEKKESESAGLLDYAGRFADGFLSLSGGSSKDHRREEQQQQRPYHHREWKRIVSSWLPPTIALVFVLSFELGRRRRMQEHNMMNGI